MDSPNSIAGPEEPPRTPPHPPYSPITPVLSHASMPPQPSPSQQIIPPLSSSYPFSLSSTPGNTLTPMSSNAPPLPTRTPIFMSEPSPVPISESSNPDVIALRSAISILQMQKQQALRDIKTLDKLKRAAVAHPEEFARELVKGNLTSKAGDIFNPTGFENEEAAANENAFEEQRTTDQERTDRGEWTMDIDKPLSFSKIPKPQQVVRMPPINWAKYHVVGESLDKLHEEQRQRPTPGEPQRNVYASQRAAEHFIAAPYRPFTDSLDPPMKTRSTSKGKK
ncbi:hypothetical protein PAAG_01664 [Paracoccidioides lutzii Pb01]|uniref:Uncharacterized protein n=1 Tax=Paracoccidioides lutzii (strain ATCC MYA-826 / Pb01) TaxID=502779 RepID=C1GT19_PARBA|nr:hypothetical protein PAAG_01664 [Paracoccidioides lutzii Pb01]EEH39202.2 hypothetical protein PAAG_01664 [Paracoccidioides lutzii Pb01]